MCELCVKQEYPDRGNFCLESGTYLWNLKECINCRKKSSLKAVDHTNVNDCGVEIINFVHRCEECNHSIALHEHKFWVEDNFQYYEMNCMLCGEAEDSRSCLPEDSRYNQNF